jgi:hypothetical protein
MPRADHAYAQPLDIDHAGNGANGFFCFLCRAFRARSSNVSMVDLPRRRPRIEIRTATAIAAPASPGIAEGGKSKADDDSERAEHVRSEMQGIGFQRLALCFHRRL